MFFLGIETSCDETGVAVYSPEKGIVAECLASSSGLHNATGGVVPEVAARDHYRKLFPLFGRCIKEAGIASNELSAIGYTRGPGLVGALMVGAAFAKGLAFALDKPCLGIHHLEGHLAAVLLDTAQEPPQWPFLALLVSGGHSHIFKVSEGFCYQLLGATRDDAAGEAFDKCASMLGLGYPGGAALAKLAQQGNPAAFALPRPMIDAPVCDLSFSGLKTAVRYLLDKIGDEAKEPRTLADLAASIEAAIVDCLVAKLSRAATTNNLTRVVIAGGVSANSRLRTAINALDLQVWLPAPNLCTDNGAMIACALAARYQAGYTDTSHAIAPLPVWPLDTRR